MPWEADPLRQPAPLPLIQALSSDQSCSGPGSPADPGQGGPPELGIKPREVWELYYRGLPRGSGTRLLGLQEPCHPVRLPLGLSSPPVPTAAEPRGLPLWGQVLESSTGSYPAYSSPVQQGWSCCTRSVGRAGART